MICGWKEATCDIHHIKPKKEGGTNDNSNLIVLCPNCHRKVHDHLLIIPENINIETLFKNWTNYYFVDLNELEKLIDVNKFDIGDISWLGTVNPLCVTICQAVAQLVQL